MGILAFLTMSSTLRKLSYLERELKKKEKLPYNSFFYFIEFKFWHVLSDMSHFSDTTISSFSSLKLSFYFAIKLLQTDWYDFSIFKILDYLSLSPSYLWVLQTQISFFPPHNSDDGEMQSRWKDKEEYVTHKRYKAERTSLSESQP